MDDGKKEEDHQEEAKNMLKRHSPDYVPHLRNRNLPTTSSTKIPRQPYDLDDEPPMPVMPWREGDKQELQRSSPPSDTTTTTIQSSAFSGDDRGIEVAKGCGLSATPPSLNDDYNDENDEYVPMPSVSATWNIYNSSASIIPSDPQQERIFQMPIQQDAATGSTGIQSYSFSTSESLNQVMLPSMKPSRFSPYDCEETTLPVTSPPLHSGLASATPVESPKREDQLVSPCAMTISMQPEIEPPPNGSQDFEVQNRSLSASFRLCMEDPTPHQHNSSEMAVKKPATTTVADLLDFSEKELQQRQSHNDQHSYLSLRKTFSSSLSLVSSESSVASSESSSSSASSCSVSSSSTSTLMHSNGNKQSMHDDSSRSTRSLPLPTSETTAAGRALSPAVVSAASYATERCTTSQSNKDKGKKKLCHVRQRNFPRLRHHQHQYLHPRVIPTPVSQRILERECSTYLLKPTTTSSVMSTSSTGSATSATVATGSSNSSVGSSQRSIASSISGATSYSGSHDHRHSRRHGQGCNDGVNHEEELDAMTAATASSTSLTRTLSNGGGGDGHDYEDDGSNGQLVEDNGRRILGRRFLGIAIGRRRSKSLTRNQGGTTGGIGGDGDRGSLSTTTSTLLTTQETRKQFIRNWMGRRTDQVKNEWNEKDSSQYGYCLMFD